MKYFYLKYIIIYEIVFETVKCIKAINSLDNFINRYLYLHFGKKISKIFYSKILKLISICLLLPYNLKIL